LPGAVIVGGKAADAKGSQSSRISRPADVPPAGACGLDGHSIGKPDVLQSPS
jgi:hypothetical protein